MRVRACVRVRACARVRMRSSLNDATWPFTAGRPPFLFSATLRLALPMALDDWPALHVALAAAPAAERERLSRACRSVPPARGLYRGARRVLRLPSRRDDRAGTLAQRGTGVVWRHRAGEAVLTPCGVRGHANGSRVARAAPVAGVSSVASRVEAVVLAQRLRHVPNARQPRWEDCNVACNK